LLQTAGDFSVEKSIILALDAMGGDHAPFSVIDGAAQLIKRHPGVSFLLYGDKAQLDPLLAAYPKLQERSQVFHTDEKIEADEKPSTALRRKDTSMRLAVEAVTRGEAHGVVSSGNTGAYMALSKILLKSIPGIARPAICTVIPTEKGRAVMLDMGATVSAEASNLTQFSLMGNIFAQEMLKKSRPTVGILNMGVEEIKGHGAVQEAAALLRQIPEIVNFVGFIEGDDVHKGTVDVVVTDGFTGNACVKMAEGMGRMMLGILKKHMRKGLLNKIALICLLPTLKKLRKQLDPGSYNGAMFIGVNGIAIKSHGSASASAFANALEVAVRMVDYDFTKNIEKDVTAARAVLGDHIFHL